MKHLFKQPFFYASIASLIALGLIIASYVFGWTTPTAAPPAGNVTLSQGALPAGSPGYVQFASSSTAFGGDAGLFWDNTNKRLGIGTTTPSEKLEVAGNIKMTGTGNGIKFPDGTSQTTAASAGAVRYSVGESAYGGVVAYIFKDGEPGYVAGQQHGLIAAAADQSAGIYWHATNDGLTGASGIVLGTGNANTNAIVALYGAESNAARLCYDLSLNGYTDWYLPSRDELNKLYINRGAIGGFAPGYYWSSSEYNSTIAWSQDFAGGTQAYNYYKNGALSVRAVRGF